MKRKEMRKVELVNLINTRLIVTKDAMEGMEAIIKCIEEDDAMRASAKSVSDTYKPVSISVVLGAGFKITYKREFIDKKMKFAVNKNNIAISKRINGCPVRADRVKLLYEYMCNAEALIEKKADELCPDDGKRTMEDLIKIKAAVTVLLRYEKYNTKALQKIADGVLNEISDLAISDADAKASEIVERW